MVQGLLVLAPLISSEEGRDMNVSAVSSSVGLPQGVHVCVRQAKISPRNSRDCVICLHVEKMTYCPVLLFTSEVSPGTARKAKGSVTGVGLARPEMPEASFSLGKSSPLLYAA